MQKFEAQIDMLEGETPEFKHMASGESPDVKGALSQISITAALREVNQYVLDCSDMKETPRASVDGEPLHIRFCRTSPLDKTNR